MPERSLSRRLALRVVRRLARGASPGDSEWLHALAAEIDHVPPGAAVLSWALGGVRLALGARVRDAGRHAALLGFAACASLAVAAVDARASSRVPLAVLVTGLAAGLAFAKPSLGAAIVLAVAPSVPLVALATGFEGPYAIDRGDAFYPVVLVLAAVGLGIRARKLRPVSRPAAGVARARRPSDITGGRGKDPAPPRNEENTGSRTPCSR